MNCSSDLVFFFKFSAFSLEYQKFFSITRTFFFSQKVRTILVTKTIDDFFPPCRKFKNAPNILEFMHCNMLIIQRHKPTSCSPGAVNKKFVNMFQKETSYNKSVPTCEWSPSKTWERSISLLCTHVDVSLNQKTEDHL